MQALHPDLVLHESAPSLGAPAPPPACEHFAGDEKKLRKALALQAQWAGAFDVTADLEDGAAVGEEVQAAGRLASILAEPRPQAYRVGCRLHPFDHPAFATDLRALLLAKPAGLAYITLPKIRDLTQLNQAAKEIQQASLFYGFSGPIPLQVLIEDAAALAHVFEIAAHPQVQFVAFGQMDFTSSHQGAIPATAMRSPGQFEQPLMRRAKLEISAACHAHGRLPTHNPTVDYQSDHQARDDALRAKNEFGFRRMWSIHPAQIAQILQAFAPSPEELEDASRILLAAQAAQWGPISDRGLLHDRASFRYYWQLLKRTRANGGTIPAEAEETFF